MDLGLERQIVLLTGANGGIGMAIAQAFLKERAQVLCFVRGGLERMPEIITWMKTEAVDEMLLEIFDIDIGDQTSLESGIEMVIAKYKRIDILVNNAGSAVEVPFLMMEDEDWQSCIDFNLNMTARLTKKVCKYMLREKKGSVVNISSIVGSATGRGVSAYGAAKAAMNRMTEILALELGRKGVRINAVAPGAIDTKMSKALMDRAGEIVLERTPLNRMGLPNEVAQAVLFLASEKTGSFITGHILNVDGGISL